MCSIEKTTNIILFADITTAHMLIYADTFFYARQSVLRTDGIIDLRM